MYRTILISSTISAQGIFKKTLACGRIKIDIGGRCLTGFPV